MSCSRAVGVSAKQVIAFKPLTLASLLESLIRATKFSTASSLIQANFPSVVIAIASSARADLLFTLPSSSFNKLTRSGTVSKVNATFFPSNGMLIKYLKKNEKLYNNHLKSYNRQTLGQIYPWQP